VEGELTTPTAQYVQIPPNSSGLKIRTVELTDSSGNTVECQAIVIADPVTAANLASVTQFGELMVTQSAQFDELIAHTKRVARLLEILVDVEVSIADAD
jgi:hypothetical protein